MNRFIRNSGFYLILFLVVVGIVQFVSNGGEATDNPRYDQLRAAIKANNVSELTVQFNGQTYLVTGQYKKAPDGAKSENFSTYIPPTDEAISELVAASETNNFQYHQE
ncbi:ATP-dependent metallopeptidase FtsH/Yme1/Tma family protein, partial [Bacillus velezensis]